jgi:hypothetical protein
MWWFGICVLAVFGIGATRMFWAEYQRSTSSSDKFLNMVLMVFVAIISLAAIVFIAVG